MTLEDQIEIQDLLALGDVMGLPEDDLQLAALLKSPLFGIDEEQLFALAHGRGTRTLHARLMAHAGGEDALGAAADRLIRYRRLADDTSVFGFYSSVLIETRQEFRRRLGPAVDETLDHFLGLAQDFGVAGGVSLTAFLAQVRVVAARWRDMDSGGGGELADDHSWREGAGGAGCGVSRHAVTGVRTAGPACQRPADRLRLLLRRASSRFRDLARDDARACQQEEETGRRGADAGAGRHCIGGWQAKNRRTLEGSHGEVLALPSPAWTGPKP